MAEKERKEDLNPIPEEVEEKVKQMLDPSVPDAPELPKEKPPKKSAKKPKSSKIEITHDAGDEPTESAPELPADEQKDFEPEVKPADEPPEEDSKSEDDVPLSLAEEEAKIRKITVKESGESPEEVAEKLGEAIAEFGPTEETGEENTETQTVPKKIQIFSHDDEETSEIAKKDEATDKAEEAPKEDEKVSSPETDKAVKEIEREESDKLISLSDESKAEDKKTLPSPVKTKKKKGLKHKLLVKTFLFVIIAGILAAGLYPSSRYFILNTARVRASSSLQIIDISTQLPLKNAQITIGGSKATTDNNGQARLTGLKLGKTKLKINRLAFAEINKDIVIGWGSNQLGDFELTPTGAQYKIKVVDFLSGKAVEGIEASTTDSSAKSDKNGLIKLTVPEPEGPNLEVEIKGNNLRTEKLSIDVNKKDETEVKTVSAQKHAFISKRSGAFDIYSIFADGKQEALVLKGSGNERDDLKLVSDPNKNQVAYVSTRGNQRNSEGFLLSNLIIINLDDNKTKSIDISEKIQVVGWGGSWVAYVKTSSGKSSSDPNRSQLMAYNAEDGSSKKLATSNYFNDLVLAAGKIFYAPSSAVAGGSPAKMFSVNLDGTNQQEILSSEVWHITRSAYGTFNFSVGQDWYQFNLGQTKAAKGAAPANSTSRVYLDGPVNGLSAWVDQRDGKGNLLVYDTKANKDSVVTAQSNLNYPIGWLGTRTLVYRIKNASETADYAVSLDGGQPLKLGNVATTSAEDDWYYY